MKKHKEGFTLVELLITIAIIGILSAIAVISYQNYVLKSQLKSAFLELKAGTIQYDLLMLDASQGEFTLTGIGFLNSNLCSYSVYPPVNGVAKPALECKLKNVASAIQNKFIYLNKLESGEWVCSASSDIRNDLMPQDCI